MCCLLNQARGLSHIGLAEAIAAISLMISAFLDTNYEFGILGQKEGVFYRIVGTKSSTCKPKLSINPLNTNKILRGWLIVHTKGSQFKISNLSCSSVPKDCFISANSVVW